MTTAITPEIRSSVDSAFLKREQEATLASPRRKYGFLGRVLFFVMDLFYGRGKSLQKFKVLEVIARVPYQAWEHVAYVAVTHMYGSPDFARRIFDFVRESRHQQDNEQWHLLILEERVRKHRIHENFLLHRILPQFMAFTYYHISWILYVMKPSWSYALNADFEDHAEHEYMEYVREHSELEREAFESIFKADYGDLANCADLFRRIGLDERLHKLESLERTQNARFA